MFNRPLDDTEYSAAVWMSQVRLLAARDFHRLVCAGPDLRTADQVERDDIAQLNLRCDNLVDVAAALRIDLNQLAETVRLATGPVDVAFQLYSQGGKLVDVDRRLAAMEATLVKLIEMLEVRL